MTASHPANPAVTRVLVVGGSYAGLSATINLLDLGNHVNPRFNYPNYKHDADAPRTPIEVTIVDERDGFCETLQDPRPTTGLQTPEPPLTPPDHLIGSPLAFASSSYAPHTWTRFADIPALQSPNVRILHGSVASVDTAAKEARVVDGATKEESVEGYDFLLAATGLRRPFPVQPQALSRKAFLLEAGEHIHSVENAADGVVVIGGGECPFCSVLMGTGSKC